MKEKIKTEMKSWLIVLVIGIIGGFLLTNYVVKVAKISGESMADTLKHGEIGITSVFKAKFLNIKRFDIVVINEKSEGYWIKRVVGLPNEKLEYRQGVLYINDQKIDEPFLNKKYLGNIAPIQLKENEYYVLGDNRDNSTDSRVIGPVMKKDIESAGFFVILPLNKVGIK